MKKWLILIVLSFMGLSGFWILWHFKLWERWRIFSTQPVFGKTWNAEVEKQKTLYSQTSFDLIFLGDSHMEQCEWVELFPGINVANRGIGGETTQGLLSRIQYIRSNPGGVVFLQIGVNDLIGRADEEELVRNYLEIISSLEAHQVKVIPTLIFYVRYIPEVNPAVTRVNKKLIQHFKSEGRDWIDLNPILSREETLSLEYTFDGIHLNASGYQIWTREIKNRLVSQEGLRFPVNNP
jgi:lysophospholipase L1-like esterase